MGSQQSHVHFRVLLSLTMFLHASPWLLLLGYRLWESLGFISALILAADNSRPVTFRKSLHIVNPLRLPSLGTTETAL